MIELVQMIVIVAIILFAASLLGSYIARYMTGKNVFLSKILKPIEMGAYRFLDIDPSQGMSPKKYIKHVLVFSCVSFIVLFGIIMAQNVLTESKISIALAFNITASFVTNTNWQSYVGEVSLAPWVQTIGLTVQNFVSAAIGISVLFALVRGFMLKSSKTIGNFWQDFVRTIVYLLLPLSIVVATILISQGVVQTMQPNVSYQTYETQTQVEIPTGLTASQVAIKQLGTNGGGYYGANSAHPFENPTALSNLIELSSIILVPAALCFAFGQMIEDKRQGRALVIVMVTVLLASIMLVYFTESRAVLNQALTSGNMEGKELRFGIDGSSLWSVFTTAASSGSVNSIHESYLPLSSFTHLFLMQTGEVIFGGVGSGLYGLLSFAILTVFIAGLMVGKTPEYLKKKVEPFEMKMAIIVVLVPPFMILLVSMIGMMLPSITNAITATGAHGFTQLLYAFTSGGANNGSAFTGLITTGSLFNVVMGLLMLVVRFVPMVAVILLAGSLANKKMVATSSGTLPTHGTLFIVLLLIVIVLIGALSFLPALALGPIAEHLKWIGGM